MAPATRERISTRSTASSRPENSFHGTVCRGTTTETETGSAAGAAAAATARVVPVRPLRKAAAAATANTATASETPTKRLFFMIFFMVTPIRQDARCGPWLKQTEPGDDTRFTPALQRTHS